MKGTKQNPPTDRAPDAVERNDPGSSPATPALLRNRAPAFRANPDTPLGPRQERSPPLVKFEEQHPSSWPRGVARSRRYLPYLILVVLPTLLASIYFYGFAANQYRSEAHFIVLSGILNVASNQAAASSSAIASLFGAGGTSSPGQAQTLAVLDYLQSASAITALRKQIPLAEIYRRPEADGVARLWVSDPSLELLHDYYYWLMADSYFDYNTGVGVVIGYGFRPDDALLVTNSLLKLGDNLVNDLNQRDLEESLRVARAEVDRAESRVATIEQKVTDFRIREKNVNPTATYKAILDVIGQMEGQLAQVRAQLASLLSHVSAQNPRVADLKAQIAALEGQIRDENTRLTGADGSLSPVLADYERLMLEQQFANQDYQAALTSLETARLQAEKQQLFVVHTVEPTLAEASRYPRSTLIVASVFIGLSVAYAIGWLIVAGFREHAG